MLAQEKKRMVFLLEEQESRVESFYEKLARTLQQYSNQAIKRVGRKDDVFAYTCLYSYKTPLLCIASWRCTAECWIALVIPRSTVTSLYNCGPSKRKRCHAVVESLFGDITDNPAVILTRHIERALGVWRSELSNLRNVLLNGHIES